MLDCCQVGDAPAPQPLAKACPACGATGRRVKPVTIGALAMDPPPVDDRYRFCGTVACDVAWFGETSRHVIAVARSRVRIGQKETATDRPVCYCFGYVARDIEEEVARTGSSNIPATITEHCRRGEDRCPETNPQGSCCLGNVRAVLRAAQAKRA